MFTDTSAPSSTNETAAPGAPPDMRGCSAEFGRLLRQHCSTFGGGGKWLVQCARNHWTHCKCGQSTAPVLTPPLPWPQGHRGHSQLRGWVFISTVHEFLAWPLLLGNYLTLYLMIFIDALNPWRIRKPATFSTIKNVIDK